MGRFPQEVGVKGSLKWIQILINKNPTILSTGISQFAGLPQNAKIEWVSPLAEDEHAEYRDEAFLRRLDTTLSKKKLAEFWPKGGPQWDALGKADDGTVFLVEAKSHISEVISHLAAKSPVSRQRILESLQETKEYMRSRSQNDWSSPFYQYANRLAHLYLLRILNDIPAYLIFVCFLNDDAMGGPTAREEWDGAIRLLHACLGIGSNRLEPFICNVFIDVQELK